MLVKNWQSPETSVGHCGNLELANQPQPEPCRDSCALPLMTRYTLKRVKNRLCLKNAFLPQHKAHSLATSEALVWSAECVPHFSNILQHGWPCSQSAALQDNSVITKATLDSSVGKAKNSEQLGAVGAWAESVHSCWNWVVKSKTCGDQRDLLQNGCHKEGTECK